MNYDGTNLEEIRAQARNGKIIAVVWGNGHQHRIVRTKKEAAELQAAMLANQDIKAEVHEYEAETLDRIWSYGNLKCRIVHGTGEFRYAEREKRVVKPIDPDAPKKYGKTRKPIGV